jgi:hypothetical protein
VKNAANNVMKNAMKNDMKHAMNKTELENDNPLEQNACNKSTAFSMSFFTVLGGVLGEEIVNCSRGSLLHFSLPPRGVHFIFRCPRGSAGPTSAANATQALDAGSGFKRGPAAEAKPSNHMTRDLSKYVCMCESKHNHMILNTPMFASKEGALVKVKSDTVGGATTS